MRKVEFKNIIKDGIDRNKNFMAVKMRGEKRRQSESRYYPGGRYYAYERKIFKSDRRRYDF